MTKLNATGDSLLYSTYLGGSDGDFGGDLAVDASGNAYMAGVTRSFDFPTNPGAFDTTCGTDANCNPDPTSGFPRFDAVIAKLDPDGSALVYSTFLGGSHDDFSGQIAVDTSGNAYMAGFTRSSDFPTANAVWACPRFSGQFLV